MTEIIEQTSNLTVKILIIGDSVVGKTCLLLRFSKNNFKSETVYTIGVHFMDRTMEVSGQLVKIQGWDTAGQERFRTITRAFYRGSHGVMIVYDVTSRKSFENVEYWIQNLKENTAVSDLSILLMGNKIDLEEERVVSTEEGENLAKQHNIPFFETSAKTGENVEKCFLLLTEQSLKKKHYNDSSKQTKQTTNVEIETQPKKKCC
ncbi:ras and ef-hand domain-containing protein [Anaeramoeba flamelloides]|uniref:Ras and ef-hand domain-containing protein n=1 Tax=Anaeramoeba flamelloides TaxID=1746091 RepID=A0ABQ8X3B9_9EUKA|nr:ras and ef-hand domain-containing protein [Anaeramoeba flamelloides]